MDNHYGYYRSAVNGVRQVLLLENSLLKSARRWNRPVWIEKRKQLTTELRISWLFLKGFDVCNHLGCLRVVCQEDDSL